MLNQYLPSHNQCKDLFSAHPYVGIPEVCPVGPAVGAAAALSADRPIPPPVQPSPPERFEVLPSVVGCPLQGQ